MQKVKWKITVWSYKKSNLKLLDYPNWEWKKYTKDSGCKTEFQHKLISFRVNNKMINHFVINHNCEQTSKSVIFHFFLATDRKVVYVHNWNKQ